jgi:hypothetical protein
VKASEAYLECASLGRVDGVLTGIPFTLLVSPLEEIGIETEEAIITLEADNTGQVTFSAWSAFVRNTFSRRRKKDPNLNWDGEARLGDFLDSFRYVLLELADDRKREVPSLTL